ncbi:hypothetical protein K438DRAFT_1748311 [Mycena galopus ATCC 62051]|nr:hypothetical protein K438DRAFT_1748311 [Mycena galopus ATCC 62051]
MSWKWVHYIRQVLGSNSPGWQRFHRACLYPDGTALSGAIMVDVPESIGVERAVRATHMETNLWLDAGRIGMDATQDGACCSIRVDRFPADAAADLKNSFTIVVCGQHDDGLLSHPVNHMLQKMAPALQPAWRGNVLVFKHGNKVARPIIQIQDKDLPLVEQILKYDALYPVAPHVNPVEIVVAIQIGGGKDFSIATADSKASAVKMTWTSKDRFFRTKDVHLHMIACLPLADLFDYGRVCVASRKDVMKLASSRVRRYTSPFFPVHRDLDTFFHHLEQRHSWIVSSVALATLSFGQDFDSPDNMNVVTSLLTESIWIQFMCGTLGFTLTSDMDCVGSYAYAGKRFMTFVHPGVSNKIITVTSSRSREVFELFIGAQSTLRCNAITAFELVSVYPDLTTRSQGVVGYWSQFTRGSHPKPSPVSAFPAQITLYDNTNDLHRPCGSACRGTVRWTNGLKGIGHWKWGGVDGMEWDEDQDVKTMGQADIRFRLGDLCRDVHCPISAGQQGSILHQPDRCSPFSAYLYTAPCDGLAPSQPWQPRPRSSTGFRPGFSRPVSRRFELPEFKGHAHRRTMYAVTGFVPVPHLIEAGEDSSAWRKSLSILRACETCLAGYGIRFSDMQLLMHGLPVLISGSTVTSFLDGPVFAPNDLDVFTAQGVGSRVVRFLNLATGFAVVNESNQYDGAAAIAKVWWLEDMASSRKINVVEGMTPQPIDTVVAFHSTVVMNAWTSTGHVTHDSQPNAAIRGGSAFILARVESSAQVSSVRITFQFGRIVTSHECGEDHDCPHTARTTDDTGCAFIPFPFEGPIAQAPKFRTTRWKLCGEASGSHGHDRCDGPILHGILTVRIRALLTHFSDAAWIEDMTELFNTSEEPPRAR